MLRSVFLSSEKTTPAKKISHNSPEQVQFVIEGVSKSVLGKIFGVNRSTVVDKLKGVAPDGNRGGYPIYKIPHVAPILMAVGSKTTEGGVDPNDPSTMLPDMRKDYWDAIAKEQKAKELLGDLWPTEKIIGMCGEAFKIIKLQIQLFEDTVNRQSELSIRQREVIVELADDLLNQVREKLVEDLQEYSDEV